MPSLSSEEGESSCQCLDEIVKAYLTCLRRHWDDVSGPLLSQGVLKEEGRSWYRLFPTLENRGCGVRFKRDPESGTLNKFEPLIMNIISAGRDSGECAPLSETRVNGQRHDTASKKNIGALERFKDRTHVFWGDFDHF